MTKASEHSAEYRRSKLNQGWGRIDTLIPPEALVVARAMVDAGEGSGLGSAFVLAMIERPKLLAEISRLRG